MSMEMELGSLMAFFFKHYPSAIYTERVTQDFNLPALFFPPPIVTSTPFTSHSYEKDCTINVKLFHESEAEAFSNAERIAEALRKSRYCLPLIKADGSSARRVLIFSDVETRMVDSGSVIMGVSQITLNWKSRHHYDFPTYEKIMHVYSRFLRNDETN